MEDEFAWLDRVSPRRFFQPNVTEGIGDDAAIYQTSPKFEDILCVDTLVEGIHFARETMLPTDIGYKALAVNISDVAAMGGSPLYYIVSAAVPATWTEDDLIMIYRGMRELGDSYEMDLLGGDTVSTDGPLVLSVTVVGRTEKGKYLTRRDAEAGDVLVITGPLGGSAAGLHLLWNQGELDFEDEANRTLLQYHQRPDPQVIAGRMFAHETSRAAVNDISDGLASEAWEIAEASEVSLHIDQDVLPLAAKWHPQFSDEQALQHALFGGEDFQLLAALPADEWPALEKQLQTEGIPALKIGTVQAGDPAVTLHAEGEQVPLLKKGYNHFSAENQRKGSE
ncbi:thiamine-phosphate kinase [Salsuginibacillus halophilus]|uniref:Thiamine-monophosphate kinase n=1 Tax=Salsuginibacillus halophilus TaxID=517424 RepID=A0A2P8HL30_9BACI|nr:thiamine-phosphate kinase [Salsuginibacillus halophilus]PSL46928.1 thiamine-phosphate kinase [Salsuginibacillus halophilus]